MYIREKTVNEACLPAMSLRFGQPPPLANNHVDRFLVVRISTTRTLFSRLIVTRWVTGITCFRSWQGGHPELGDGPVGEWSVVGPANTTRHDERLYY